jgi:hypothetical protein
MSQCTPSTTIKKLKNKENIRNQKYQKNPKMFLKLLHLRVIVWDSHVKLSHQKASSPEFLFTFKMEMKVVAISKGHCKLI